MSEGAIAMDGLVERRDSAIKAVSSTTTPIDRHVQRSADSSAPPSAVPPPNADVARMVVIPAGGYGKSPSPRRKTSGGHSRTPSGSVVIDVTARTGSRTAATPTRDLDRLHVENRAPPRFICPVSGRIMRDPVILATGTTCDRGAMECRLAKGHKRCPVTKRPLKKPIHMMPNVELRQNITNWAKKNAPWLLDDDEMLESKYPHPFELQGNDPQYVNVSPEPAGGEEAPGASGPNRSPSRIDAGKGQWTYTNGSKVCPGAAGSYNINASSGGGGGAVDAPWRAHSGIASPTRSIRRSHRRTTSSRSGSPSKKAVIKRDWYSTGFLGVISVVYLSLFIASLSKCGWTMAPMDVNPWYGATPQALAEMGAQVLPLMEGPGNQWWRLASSMFLPAGLIQLALCLAGLWMYGRYAQLALPWPQVSVAGMYLLPSLLGSLTSINLNADYVSCGAAAGVCGLLGTVCADQLLNWRNKRLFNLREWWIAAIILMFNAGVFIALSLMPMTDVWYASAGFLAGILSSLVLLLLPRVGKGKERRNRWLVLQISCAVLVVGCLIAASVGCALPTKLGENVAMLKDASCLDFNNKWWKCAPYGSSPSGCTVTVNKNEDALLYCPRSTFPLQVPGLTAAQTADAAAVDVMCRTYCSGVGMDPVASPPAVDEIPVTVIQPLVNALPAVTPPAADAANLMQPVSPEQIPIVGLAGTPQPAVTYMSLSTAGRKLRAGGDRT